MGAVQLLGVLEPLTAKLTLACPAGTVTGLRLGKDTGKVQSRNDERGSNTSLRSRSHGFRRSRWTESMLVEVTAMSAL